MIRIKKESITQTSVGCPSQWEAKTMKGEGVYIRLRHGAFSLDVMDKREFTSYPKGFDGVMSTSQLIDYLNGTGAIIKVIVTGEVPDKSIDKPFPLPHLDYSKVKNQIGCGYCAKEKVCKIKDPKINKAKQGCKDWQHHTKDKSWKIWHQDWENKSK